MTDTERDYYLRLVRMQFPKLTKREKRRMWRKHRLLYIAIDRLCREAR
jgi:hypothetical protein